MKQLLSRINIAPKIMLVVVVTMATAVLLTSVALNFYDAQTQEKLFFKQANLLAGVIANSSTAAVAFLDQKNATAELETLQNVSSVRFACLYSSQMNQILASLRRPNSHYQCGPFNDTFSQIRQADEVIIHQPMERRGVQIGGLYLVVSTEYLEQRRHDLTIILLFSALASCAIALVLTNGMRRMIHQPIMRLSEVAHNISRYRDWTLRAEKISEDELGHLVEVFNDMVSHIEDDQKKLEKMAYYDPLTALPNRRLLEERMERAIARARRLKTMFAVCFIDLDDFKWVNDTLGHDNGDSLLVQLSLRITAALRTDDTLARFGGDEFVVIAEGLPSEEDVEALGEKILDALSPTIMLEDQYYQARASIGIAFGNEYTESMYTVLKQADIAVYAAKASGKNTYRVYDTSMVVDDQRPE